MVGGWTFQQVDDELHVVVRNAIINCKGTPDDIEIDLTVSIIEELLAENPGVLKPGPQAA